MFKNNLLTILGFKAVWLSCFFGEIYINSFFGFFSGLIFLSLFIYFKRNKIIVLKIIILYSIVGYFFDSLLSFFELYKIVAQVNFLFLPLWFVVLWPSFCCLLVDALTFLKNKRLFSIFLGAVFGPLTYFSAVSGGLATVSSLTILFLISLFWSLLMLIYSQS